MLGMLKIEGTAGGGIYMGAGRRGPTFFLQAVSVSGEKFGDKVTNELAHEKRKFFRSVFKSLHCMFFFVFIKKIFFKNTTKRVNTSHCNE